MNSDPVLAVRPGEHACCRFAHTEDRERLALAFVRDGLRRGRKVVYLRDDDGDADQFLARLREADDEAEPALASGQIEIRSAMDAYLPDATFDIERTVAVMNDEHLLARDQGYLGLSIIGETGWALCQAAAISTLAEYERRLAVVFKADDIVALCQYDHRRFPPATLHEVAEAHTVDVSPDLAPIGRDGCLAAARVRMGNTLRVAGELDFSTAQALGEVLDAHYHGPLRLDLTDMRYVDVAGMRALRGRKGQPLTIAGASAAVRRLLVLMAWDTDPGVVLEAA